MHPFIELCARTLYFGLNIPSIRTQKKKRRVETPKITISDLEVQMKRFGINFGDTLMVHSSFRHLENSAEEVIDFLKDYIGKEGNLLMPTHPELKDNGTNLIYEIEKSKSTVGFLTESFRKSEGVFRSEHPFSSIAVWGKDAKYLLEGNLNANRPLPHGIDSPYYKMAKMGGKVLCIGVPAIRRGTIRHTAEEVLDENYRVKDLYNTYKVEVKRDGISKMVEVRALNLKKSQIFIAKSKIEKEWLENKILVKSVVNNVPVEFIDAKECVEFMITEAEKGNTCYPYAPKRW